MVDIIVPTVFGFIFAAIGSLFILRREGAQERYIWYVEHYTLWRFLPRWLRGPSRVWPRRYDSLVWALGGVLCILFGLFFFGIAIAQVV
jgi:drug/metabolite transporter (DMT)-like permease